MTETDRARLRQSSWLLVSYGALAGLCLSAPDVVFGLRFGAPLSSAGGLLGFWLWSGVLVGVLAFLGYELRRWVGSKLPSASSRAWLDAAVTGIVAVPVARLLFAGDGIRRSPIGIVGPWLLPVLAFAGMRVASWLVARWARRDVSLGVRLASGALVLAVGCAGVYVERTVHPSMYFPLHTILLSGLLVVFASAAYLLLVPRHVRLAAVALAVLALPLLARFPAAAVDRELLADTRLAAGRVVAVAQSVDLDGDGRSRIFGGGDCDDTDARTFVGAEELPGDGRDSNCDGLDDPRVTSRRYTAFATNEAAAREIREKARNFPTLVLVIDALRSDRVGGPSQPNLSRLAAESIVFKHAYASASTTKISVPTLLTGHVRPGPEDAPIAEVLHGAGRTSVFSAVEIVRELLVREIDFLRGFTRLEIVPVGHVQDAWGGGVNVATDARVTAGVLGLLGSAAPPALTWVHYFDLHQWNELDDATLPPRGDVSRYDAVLARVDAGLEPVLALKDRVNLVVLADHGESLGVNGQLYHTRYLFREMVQVPLMIRVPGVAPAVVETPVGLAALYNTLLDLQGLPARTDGAADSLLGLVGAGAPGDGPGFAAFDTREWALSHGRYRLIYAPDTQITRLYDLVSDERETRNIAPAQPELTKDLLDRLFVLHQKLGRPLPS